MRFFFIVLLICLCACDKQIAAEDYFSYIKNSGLCQKQNIDGLRVEVLYKPSSYVAWEKYKRIGEKSYQNYHQLDSGLHFFEIRFSGKDLLLLGEDFSQAAFQQNYHYYAFNYASKLELKQGEASCKNVLYHFESSGSSHRTIHIAFEKVANLSDKLQLSFPIGAKMCHFEINLIDVLPLKL